MGASSGDSVLAVLERAEMAARERRLAASAEAERIRSAGQVRAAALSARAQQRVAEALASLRARTEATADRAIETLEREASARAGVRARPSDGEPAFDRAVELVVALVLAEEDSPGDGKDGA